jgi:hypothetical protein
MNRHSAIREFYNIGSPTDIQHLHECQRQSFEEELTNTSLSQYADKFEYNSDHDSNSTSESEDGNTKLTTARSYPEREAESSNDGYYSANKQNKGVYTFHYRPTANSDLNKNTNDAPIGKSNSSENKQTTRPTVKNPYATKRVMASPREENDGEIYEIPATGTVDLTRQA